MTVTPEQVAVLADMTAEELERRAQKILLLVRQLRRGSASLRGQPMPTDGALEHVGSLELDKPEEEPPPEPPKKADDESVGRFGIVRIGTARVAAQVLGEFDRRQFAERIGLPLSSVTTWLQRLIDEQTVEYYSGTYTCLTRPSPRDWIVHQKETPFSIEQFATALGLDLVDATQEIANWQHKRVVEQIDGNGTYKYLPPDPREDPREHHTETPPENLRPSYDLATPERGMPVRVSASQKATRRQRSTAGAGGIKGAKQRDRRYKEMQERKAQRSEARQSKAQKDSNWQNRSGKRTRTA